MSEKTQEGETKSPTLVARGPDPIRRSRPRQWLPLIAVLVVVVTGGVVWFVQRDDLPDDAVLRVEDTVISQREYEHRIDVLAALYGLVPPTEGKDEDKFRRDAAKSIAVSELLEKAARSERLAVGDKEAESQLNDLIDEQMTGGREAFVKFLADSGISNADVLDEVRRQMLTSLLFDKVTADTAKISDADVAREYESRKAEMVSAERRRVANIVVATSREADQVLRQLQRGSGFGVVARQVSLDASTRDRGGELGWVTAAELDPAFSKAAFAAKPGVPFGPVQTEHGWNVALVSQVDPSEALALAQVSDQLRKVLQDRNQLDRWRQWLADEIEQADIEYADEYRPSDPDAPPADAPTTEQGS